MKKRIIAITITLLVVIAGALTLVQCDHSNMARVTIHIQNELYAQKSESVIDKILNIFSSNLYAGATWDSSKESVELIISADNMDTIEANIPTPFNSFTIEIPAGANRQFTLNSYSQDIGYGSINNFGAITNITLTPGDNIINIQMKPKTIIDSLYYEQIDAWTVINWYPSYGSISNFTRYNIYRANSPNGTYYKIYSEIDQNENSYNDNDANTFGETYYYKISISTNYGEGPLSDYKSITINY